MLFHVVKPHRDDQGVVGMSEAQRSCIQRKLVSVQVRNRELLVVPSNERGDRSKEGGFLVLCHWC